MPNFLMLRWYFRPYFRWYDIWIGVYIDRYPGLVYVQPLPMIGVRISWWQLKVLANNIKHGQRCASCGQYVWQKCKRSDCIPF